ncbi:restriction endonuclease subunit S [Formosa sp. A9]|uniref:restriction endonuclease subunit S n=1 Tax=Formosa sp. A9 TaxID=3442641 RepID=UPI003EBD3E04
MREGWELKTLSEVYDVRDGTHDSPKYIDEGYPLITSKNLKDGVVNFDKVKFISEEDYSNINKRSKVNVGDVLFAMIGTIGNPTVVFEEPNYAIKNIALFKVKSNNNSNFLKYYLESPYVVDKMLLDAKGSTQKFVGLGYLRKFPICIPPLEEQQQIVAILDQAYTAIDQAKANIEKNIENAKEFYQNWTFNTIIKADWEAINWGNICDFTRGPFGGSLKKSMFVESGYAVYEQKQAIHNDYDALRYFINEDKFQEMKRFEVKSGDLLMSCSGVTLGRVSEVPPNAPSGIINQALLKLTTKPNYIINDFLVIWIRSKIFQDLIFKAAGGAAQPNVPSVKILKNIKVPCPTLEEQQVFVKLHGKVYDFTQNLINGNVRKLESLDELKKSILQKAFAGELTNKAVEV